MARSTIKAARAAQPDRPHRLGPCLVAFAIAATGCSTVESFDPEPPNFADDVQPILAAKCGECHSGDEPAGEYRVATYLDATGCVPSGAPAAFAGDGPAPILAVLAQEDHGLLLSEDELATITTWIDRGSLARRGRAHPSGFIDVRSSDFHGAVLRRERWARMLDLEQTGACGRCHAGAPVHPEEGTYEPLAAATPCTTCHDSEESALGCGTCHGDGERAYPPRNACRFPEEADLGGAHAAHVDPAAQATDNRCWTCHPVRDASQLAAGEHGDGHVDLLFDPDIAGADATYAGATGTCMVACHARQGTRIEMTWRGDQEVRCGDCHDVPPADHYTTAACSFCHAEVDAAGTMLTGRILHANGRIDIADGKEQCNGCHGSADDSDDIWPRSGAHDAHRSPSSAEPVACETCHRLPEGASFRDQVLADGHLRDVASDVQFSGPRATARGATPSFDMASATCADVACHGAGLPGAPAIEKVWRAAAAGRCGTCHGLPPAATHAVRGAFCGTSSCHGDEVVLTATGYAITAAGRALHINGVVDVAGGGG